MAHKHNRRRNRSNRKNVITFTAVPASILPPSNAVSLSSFLVSPPTVNLAAKASSNSTSIPPPRLVGASKITSKHWQNRYQNWQNRQKHQRQETLKLSEAEQQRIFGGLPGDDPTLCEQMLDYFDRLDYIS